MKNVVIVPNFFVLVVTVVLFCFISLCCFFLFFFFVCLFFDCPIIVIFMHYSSRWSLETNLVFPAASFKKSQKIMNSISRYLIRESFSNFCR